MLLYNHYWQTFKTIQIHYIRIPIHSCQPVQHKWMWNSSHMVWILRDKESTYCVNWRYIYVTEVGFQRSQAGTIQEVWVLLIFWARGVVGMFNIGKFISQGTNIKNKIGDLIFFFFLLSWNFKSFIKRVKWLPVLLVGAGLVPLSQRLKAQYFHKII